MGGKKSKKPAPPAADEVRRPHEVAAERRARTVRLSYLVPFAAAALVAGVTWHPVPFALAIVLYLVGEGTAARLRSRGELAACRALLDHEHWEAAVTSLKELQRKGGTADEATYLVALAYDRQEARKLALESYKAYLQRFKRGVWAVEARVRVEELEAAPLSLKPLRPIDVELNCPYCKSSILEGTPVAECSGCATAHHAGCYDEQGGCAVYGCESKTARARVRS